MGGIYLYWAGPWSCPLLKTDERFILVCFFLFFSFSFSPPPESFLSDYAFIFFVFFHVFLLILLMVLVHSDEHLCFDPIQPRFICTAHLKQLQFPIK